MSAVFIWSGQITFVHYQTLCEFSSLIPRLLKTGNEATRLLWATKLGNLAHLCLIGYLPELASSWFFATSVYLFCNNTIVNSNCTWSHNVPLYNMLTQHIRWISLVLEPDPRKIDQTLIAIFQTGPEDEATFIPASLPDPPFRFLRGYGNETKLSGSHLPLLKYSLNVSLIVVQYALLSFPSSGASLHNEEAGKHQHGHNQ